MNPYLNINLDTSNWTFLYSEFILCCGWPETEPYSSEPEFNAKVIDLGWNSRRQSSFGHLEISIDKTVLWYRQIQKQIKIVNGYIIWTIPYLRSSLVSFGSSIPYEDLRESTRQRINELDLQAQNAWIPVVPDNVIVNYMLNSGYFIVFADNPTKKIAFAIYDVPIFAIEGSFKLYYSAREAAEKAVEIGIKGTSHPIDLVDRLEQHLNASIDQIRLYSLKPSSSETTREIAQ